jgi:hypothetical protein
MEINDRLKKVIFKKLYNDLSHIEIIPYEDSIWFIDRDKKYWYLEFKNNGHLWWRHGYFNRFFIAFSLERIDYEPIIAEWVEDVLNNKVITTQTPPRYLPGEVEDVLNNKVITTQRAGLLRDELVEDVLNNKVITTLNVERICDAEVEQVLNSK